MFPLWIADSGKAWGLSIKNKMFKTIIITKKWILNVEILSLYQMTIISLTEADLHGGIYCLGE